MMEFCVRNKATATELLFNSDLQKRLEDTGMAIMHAVQVQATAATSPMPFRERVVFLGRLANQLIVRVAEDTRKNLFPAVKAEEFALLATALKSHPNGRYLLDGTLTVFMRGTGWNEKILRLCQVLDRTPPQSDGAGMVFGSVDEILTEIFSTQAAVLEALGAGENFGDTIINELNLLLGIPPKLRAGMAAGPEALAKWFSGDLLPMAKRELGTRIIADIQNLRRLRDNALNAELDDFRQIVQLSRKAIGPYLPREAIMPALELRASRFVAPDILNTALGKIPAPDEKLAWLFFLERCIVGGRSRYKIADTIFRIMTAEAFRTRMLPNQAQPEDRLKTLADLNARALVSGFDADQRKKMADAFDTYAFDIAVQAKTFEAIADPSAAPYQRVLAGIDLFTRGLIPKGKCSDALHKVLLTNLSHPEFLPGYLTHWAQERGVKLDAMSALLDLVRTMCTTGLTPDAVLNAFKA